MTSRWEDHHEICDVLHCFAQALDSRDFDLYRRIMTDEVRIDYSSWRPDEPARTERADDWVARGSLTMLGLDATQHSLTNVRTQITGDEATATAYVVAEHFSSTGGEAGTAFVLNGFYEDGFVRTPDGWRLSAIALHVRWASGNREIMAGAKDRARAAGLGWQPTGS